MPRTREQNEAMREAMRERILKGAVVCFALNGYSGTKIGQLAKFIGIGQGTLYNYFASKEDVFNAILEQATEQNSASFDALRRAPISAVEKIRFLSERMTALIHDESDTAYELVLNFRMGEEAGSDNMFTESYGDAPSAVLADIILTGQNEGAVVPGDPVLLADYYWAVVHSLAYLKLIHKSHYTIPAEWLTRLLVLDSEENK